MRDLEIEEKARKQTSFFPAKTQKKGRIKTLLTIGRINFPQSRGKKI